MGYTGEQQREYQRRWLKARRNEWIDSQGGHCNQCGSTEALEIDHINRADKACNISTIWSRAAHVREAELSKCQVLCSDCHLVKTSREWDSLAKHGTMGMYKRGCRCVACRQVNRDRVRRQR